MQSFAQVEAAEHWGLDVIWIAELHFLPKRSVASAPLLIVPLHPSSLRSVETRERHRTRMASCLPARRYREPAALRENHIRWSRRRKHAGRLLTLFQFSIGHVT